ncbi:MAG: hypothetical protein M5U32_18385 [Myxococcota bacterium]|nr:hypothetical protein [Myxococcota bacterium]
MRALGRACDDLVNGFQGKRLVCEADEIDGIPEELAKRVPPIGVPASEILTRAAHLEHRHEEPDNILGEAGASARAPALVFKEVESERRSGLEEQQVIQPARLPAIGPPAICLVGLCGQDQAAEAGREKGPGEGGAAARGLAGSGGAEDLDAFHGLADGEAVLAREGEKRPLEDGIGASGMYSSSGGHGKLGARPATSGRRGHRARRAT